MAKRDNEPKRYDFGYGESESVAKAQDGSGGWFKAILVIALCLGAGAAYVYYFERDLAERWLKNTPLEPKPMVTTIYKWRDAQGNWQITDRPPPEGAPYEILKYRSDANILPSPRELEEKNK